MERCGKSFVLGECQRLRGHNGRHADRLLAGDLASDRMLRPAHEAPTQLTCAGCATHPSLVGAAP